MKMELIVIAVIVTLVIAVGAEKMRRVKTGRSGQFEIIVIDGCEYFMCPNQGQYVIVVHKGNCTNAFHLNAR